MPVKKKEVKKPSKILLKTKKIKNTAKKEKPKKNIKKIVTKTVTKTTTKKVVKKAVKEIKPKKVVVKKEKKVIEKSLPAKENFVFSPEALFKAKIKVVGIGGGGGSIVAEIGRTLQKATFLIADTDIRALKKRNGIKHLCFGENLTHGLGTGVNVELAQQAAEESKDKFRNIFEGQDIVIFIASLGGGLGSGATQSFIEAAKEFGGITLGIFTLPFKFEGKNKSRIAQTALKSLRQSLNVSLVIPNEKIFKIIDENTPITEAFSMVNKSLVGSLESLIDLIYNPGIINIDFADLKTILRGKGNQAFLNTIEESGKDRAEKICEKIFANPLLQTSNFTAENILFNIVGAENLSMFEVEKVSRHISELNPKAKIIFGISKNPKLKSKIKTTILMTGDGLKDEAPEKHQEPVKPAVVAIKEVKVEKEDLKVKEEVKQQENKKPAGKNKTKAKKKEKNKKEENKSSILGNNLIPSFEDATSASALSMEKRLSIIDASLTLDSNKKTIRRSGLEVKKAEDQEEKKKMEQEKEWEVPAFLRRVKYKS